MRCPICSNQLKQIKYKTIVLDQCSKCKGVWFDSGELLELARIIKGQGCIIAQKEPEEMPKIKSISSVKKKEKLCPKCQCKLTRFNYSYDSNIFLDKCSNCDGVWADKGETKQVARYLQSVTKAKAVKRQFREVAVAEKNALEKPKIDKETKKIIAKNWDDPHIRQIRAEREKINRNIQNLKDIKQVGNFLNMRVSPACYFLPLFSIPFGDDRPRERFPLVTISIITLCTIIFILQIIFVGDIKVFFNRYGHIPSDFFSIGLITSMFLHGSFMHLFGNMLFLWIFGDNVEDRFTRFAYLVFYLLCGLAASVAHALANLGLEIPCIGASGAISGVMGAYVVFYPRAKVKLIVYFKTFSISAYIYLGAWIVYQIYMGTIHIVPGIIIAAKGGVAWFAHIGGFLFGMLVAFVIKKYAYEEKERPIS